MTKYMIPAIGGPRDGGTICSEVIPNHGQAMKVEGEQFKHHRYRYDAIRQRFEYVGVIVPQSSVKESQS